MPNLNCVHIWWLNHRLNLSSGCGKEAQNMYSWVDVAISGAFNRLLKGLVTVGCCGLMCRRLWKILSNSSVRLSEDTGHLFSARSEYYIQNNSLIKVSSTAGTMGGRCSSTPFATIYANASWRVSNHSHFGHENMLSEFIALSLDDIPESEIVKVHTKQMGLT